MILHFLLVHPFPYSPKGAIFWITEYVFLLAGKIMPGAEKVQGEHLLLKGRKHSQILVWVLVQVQRSFENSNNSVCL